MIDLYAAGTSNGMRARIALEECGLPYTLHPVDIAKGEHKTPQFLAMNPNGQIPVIVDRDGPGGKPLTLSQSTAILVYAAEKSGKFMPKDPAARAAMLQALMSASTDVTPVFGAYFACARAKEPHAPAVQMFKDRIRAFLRSGTTPSPAASTAPATRSASPTSPCTRAMRASRARRRTPSRACPTSRAGATR